MDGVGRSGSPNEDAGRPRIFCPAFVFSVFIFSLSFSNSLPSTPKFPCFWQFCKERDISPGPLRMAGKEMNGKKGCSWDQAAFCAHSCANGLGRNCLFHFCALPSPGPGQATLLPQCWRPGDASSSARAQAYWFGHGSCGTEL